MQRRFQLGKDRAFLGAEGTDVGAADQLAAALEADVFIVVILFNPDAVFLLDADGACEFRKALRVLGRKTGQQIGVVVCIFADAFGAADAQVDFDVLDLGIRDPLQQRFTGVGDDIVAQNGNDAVAGVAVEIHVAGDAENGVCERFLQSDRRFKFQSHRAKSLFCRISRRGLSCRRALYEPRLKAPEVFGAHPGDV